MKRNKWLMITTILLGVMIIPKILFAQEASFMEATISNENNEFILHLKIDVDNDLFVVRKPSLLNLNIFDVSLPQQKFILIENEYAINQEAGMYLKDIHLNNSLDASDSRVTQIFIEAELLDNDYQFLASREMFLAIPYPQERVRYIDITDECEKTCATNCLVEQDCAPDDCIINYECMDSCVDDSNCGALVKTDTMTNDQDLKQLEQTITSTTETIPADEETPSVKSETPVVSELEKAYEGPAPDPRYMSGSGGMGKCSLTKNVKLDSDSNLLILLSLIAAVGLLNFRAERQKVKVLAQKKKRVRKIRRVRRKK